MSTLVADASVLIKCLLPEPGSVRARRLVSGTEPAIAPELVLAECANAVWKRVHRKLLDTEQAVALQTGLLEIPLDLRPLGALTPLALALALEYDHPICDCYYLAAAIQSVCPLATADATLYDLAQRVGLGEHAILVR